MDKRDALRELLGKVEAGARLYPSDVDPVWSLWGDDCKASLHTLLASDRSLDAAKALHEAVLPDWFVGLDQQRTYWTADITKKGNRKYASGEHADNPARAWLVAILRALIAEGEKP